MVLLFGLALSAGFHAHAQPLIRVRAETRIELAPRSRESNLVVEGALRDDLGAALGDRPVELTVRDSATGARLWTHASRTDASGRFSAVAPLSPGHYTVHATYVGDDHFDGEEVVRDVVAGREHVRLDVEIEGGPSIDLDVERHRFIVRAESRAGSANLRVKMSENGRELRTGFTDSSGALEFDLGIDELGTEPSAARVVFRSEADQQHAEAQTEVPVVRWARTELTLDIDRDVVEEDESLLVSGTLRTRRAVLPRKAVGLTLSDREEWVATVLTDDHGRFSIPIRATMLPAGESALVARFAPDAPWYGPSRSIPRRVRRDAPSNWTVKGALISLALTALAFAIASSRRAGAKTTSVIVLPQSVPPLELGTRAQGRPESFRISGTVLGLRTSEPIAEATVRLWREDAELPSISTDRAGRFLLESRTPGIFSLEITATGYEGARHRFTLPHRGEWEGIFVRLRSIRELAWEPLRTFAVRMISADAWAQSTGREIEAIAQKKAPDSPGIPDLVRAIEVAAYGPTAPTLADLEQIRTKADDIERELMPTLLDVDRSFAEPASLPKDG